MCGAPAAAQWLRMGLRPQPALHHGGRTGDLVRSPLFDETPTMQAVTQNDYVSIADYLKAELTSDVRHELLLNSFQLQFPLATLYEGI